MNRVIVVSDSHGDVTGLRMAFEQARRHGHIDAAVFLGDGLDDFETVRQMPFMQDTVCYAVRGNNDWGSYEEGEIVFQAGGARFYACHGHQRYVKYNLDRLWYAAREREAQVALYGHTHRERVDFEGTVTMINPGAVCERRAGRTAYAEIIVEDNGFAQASLMKWE